MKKEKKKESLLKWFAWFAATKIGKIVVLIVVISILVSTFAIAWGTSTRMESKTTWVGLHDIGELATQETVATVVAVTEKNQTLGDFNIPFTQTKYVYSYDVSVKAGYDFARIQCRKTSLDENSKAYACTLPQPEILSTELLTDSFNVYHEENSIFTHVTLEENNAQLEDMQKTGQETAIQNGLFEQAEKNAKIIIESFLKGALGSDAEISFETEK